MKASRNFNLMINSCGYSYNFISTYKQIFSFGPPWMMSDTSGLSGLPCLSTFFRVACISASVWSLFCFPVSVKHLNKALSESLYNLLCLFSFSPWSPLQLFLVTFQSDFTVTRALEGNSFQFWEQLASPPMAHGSFTIIIAYILHLWDFRSLWRNFLSPLFCYENLWTD